MVFRALLISAFMFFIQDTWGQSPRKVALIGVTTGLADFGQREKITGAFYHIQPGFGFFVHENVALGLFINVSSFGYNDYPYTAFGLGPFMRVMADNIFFQASFDFGLVTDEIFPYSKITIAGGYALHLSKSFALEPQLFYTGHNESGRSFDFDGLGIGLGLQFYAHRNP